MTRLEICEKIKEIIRDTIKERVELGNVSENLDLIEEMQLNSLEGLEILVRTEDAFGFEIDDEDLSVELMRTISNLCDYIEKKLAIEV